MSTIQIHRKNDLNKLFNSLMQRMRNQILSHGHCKSGSKNQEFGILIL
jgi:hypothetical protein